LSSPRFDHKHVVTKPRKTGCECRYFAKRVESLVLDGRPVTPVEVGVIGRRTELLLIPSGQGRIRIVSPHELPVGEI
jgi:hypothetical protein